MRLTRIVDGMILERGVFFMSRASILISSLASSLVLSLQPVYGQAVLSARSGVVHYFEGAVTVDGQPLEQRLGKFTNVSEGSELRTAQGRAEVLLTPGVLMRVGEQSAIRMISSALNDTRVELLQGSAIVDASEPSPGTSVTVTYQDWSVQLADKGSYRIDCDPPRVRVRDGQLSVWSARDIEPVSVNKGNELQFGETLTPEKAESDPHDSLSDWADGRAESVSADNAIAADIQDPGSMSFPGLPPDGFTYFPMLGLSPVGSALYNPTVYQPALPVLQPGFYSIYLPGYTRRPSLLGLPIGGFGGATGLTGLHGSPYSPVRIGIPGSTLPRPIGVGPRPIMPPVTRPVTPAPRGGVVRH